MRTRLGSLFTSVLAAVISVFLTTVVISGASSSSATSIIYACVKAGTLSNVGVSKPKCSSGATVISWNQVGAAGPIGPTGAKGNRGSVWSTGTSAPVYLAGEGSGDIYLNTVTGDVFQFTGVGWARVGSIQGPAGAIGAVGPIGPQGLTGNAGPAGIQGPVGPTGGTGATGALGPIGPQGLTGNAGPAGIQGPAGPTGETGATGAIGALGPIGPQGLTGNAGQAGIQGPAGPTGETGATGALGPIGPQGLTGNAGQAGIQGPVGPTGDTGATGPQGQAGPQGPPGGSPYEWDSNNAFRPSATLGAELCSTWNLSAYDSTCSQANFIQSGEIPAGYTNEPVNLSGSSQQITFKTYPFLINGMTITGSYAVTWAGIWFIGDDGSVVTLGLLASDNTRATFTMSLESIVTKVPGRLISGILASCNPGNCSFVGNPAAQPQNGHLQFIPAPVGI